MELSNSTNFDQTRELEKVIETMSSVSLPSDFWDDFESEVRSDDDLNRNHDLLRRLTSFQHHASFKRTTRLVHEYKSYNMMMSGFVHDQGDESFVCWAFSATSMIGNSCRVLVKDLKEQGRISEEKYKKCIEHINDSEFHPRTRNAIMMILLPRQLHVDDRTQEAFLRAAVSRLANPTIIDREGIFYLERVTTLIESLLGLDNFPVKASYKMYYNSRHRDYEPKLKPLVDDAKDKLLCPVASIDVSVIPDGPDGHGSHAMVLDTIIDGNFVFKNSYVNNKQVTIPVEDGPLEFIYLHIKLTQDGLNKLKYD